MHAEVKNIDQTAIEHVHDFHQIVLGLNGYVDFRINDDLDAVSPAKGCVIPANVSHFFVGNKDSKVLVIDIDTTDELLKPNPVKIPTLSNGLVSSNQTQYVADISGDDKPWSNTKRRIDAINISDAQKLFQAARYFEVHNNFRRLYTSCASELSRFSDEQLMHCISAMMLHSVSARVTDMMPRQQSHHRINVEKLRQWVSLNLTEKITVSSMADIMCMSVSHFHTCFVASAHKTPHQFVVEIRLQHALDKVRNTNLSFSCIADEVGFSSQSAMTNTFRKHLGNSPLQLRKHYSNVFR